MCREGKSCHVSLQCLVTVNLSDSLKLSQTEPGSHDILLDMPGTEFGLCY